ncbi:hypothetical protein [Luteipulveratus flavus]|uniref:HTH cro/C1-type domain-containing protein n=1 Tax=Luteipulveratus flavus TaxID=3031728 RepID=A0ABT6CD49_9MICO|nr:hypothetical protein [Luteipulveratus sp. YIM 133296]MDF8266443.1 hypothetical protein [Luteipulveratus sp. YIM 133296]
MNTTSRRGGAGGHPSFDEALRSAIAHRGLALSRVRDHLATRGQHVGVSTLSYWQNGERQPTTRSLPVVHALEQVLALPPGTLTTLVTEDASREARRSRLAGMTEFGGTIDELIGEMGSPSVGQSACLSVSEGIAIGRERSMETKHVHQVVRAVEDVDRQVVAYQGEPGCDAARISFLAISGCRIGRLGRHAPTGMVVAELLFDRLIRRQETHVFQYMIKDDNRIPMYEHYRMHLYSGGTHVVELQFHPDAVPVRIEEFHRRRLQDPDSRCNPVPIYHGGRAHLVTEPAAPAVTGLRWEYD